MRVQTEFEIKHFITFVNINIAPVKMTIIDFKDTFYITKVNGDDFEIHEMALTALQSNCPAMQVENKLVH